MKTLVFFTFGISLQIVIGQPIGNEFDTELSCNDIELQKARNDYEDCKKESTRFYTEKCAEAKRINEILKNSTDGYDFCWLFLLALFYILFLNQNHQFLFQTIHFRTGIGRRKHTLSNCEQTYQ